VKLFTIGDSISQGFMSLAAARTELSFSTLIARSLGLIPGTDNYPIPIWGAGGIPLNIESLFRTLQRKYGTDISGRIEWPLAVVTVNEFLDDVEDYYERGGGNIALPQAGHRSSFPNVAVAGFTIADAWMVTPALCVERVIHDPASSNDGLFALPTVVSAVGALCLAVRHRRTGCGQARSARSVGRLRPGTFRQMDRGIAPAFVVRPPSRPS
jgi:hypothetical protein